MALVRWLFAAMLAAGTPAAGATGDAWNALLRERPADAAALPAPWRDALARMSAAQLDALRRGTPASELVLDGGETLGDFLALRGVVGLPATLAVAPAGGGTASGGGMEIQGTFATLGNDVPNGSLTGAGFRLDPLLPGGGGTSRSASPSFLIDASVGQPTVAGAISEQTTLRSGFWTAADAAAIDRVFGNGFE